MVTILALLGLTAGLTACGVSRTLDPVAAAASKTQSAGGMKLTMAIEITDGSSQKTYSIAADGAFDRDQGELTIDLSSALGSAGLPAGTAGSVKLLYLQEDGDTVMYLNFPPLASQLPGGRSWIRLDLQKAGKVFGVDLNQLLGQSNQNPAEALDMLRASGEIKKVGPDTIGGVATTEYKGAIDLAKAAELHGISTDLVQRLIAAGAPSDLPVEVWVGDDGLVRQLRLTENLQAGGHSGTVVVTIDLSDFGRDVSVSAPPADDVFDATAFAALAAQAQTGSATGSANP